MPRVTFGHANQSTSRPTIHEEVLGELIFLLKGNHGWHGDIPALSKGMEQHGVLTGQGRESKVSRPRSHPKLVTAL